MPKLAIVTDSGCDLPSSQCAQLGIHIVPLVVRFGTQVYLDGQLSLEQFWGKIAGGDGPPASSQPSAGQFAEAFAACVQQGYDVLCLTITSRHSGTFNSANLAAQDFPGRVTVFDTLALSLAQGYQAIIAAQAAAAGVSVAEIVQRLESVRNRSHMYIALDTVEYLRRGGRADQLMPVLDRVVKVLNIKPTIEVVDGQLKLLGVDRSRERSFLRIQQEVGKQAPPEMLVVAHTRNANEALRLAHAESTRLGFPFERMLISEAGPVLSCHAGPGVVAEAIIKQA